MIRTIVFVMVLAGSGWLLADDDKKDPPTRTDGMLPAGFNKLGLSEAQWQKVYDTLFEYKTKIDELKNQIRDLEIKEGEELQKILTDAQKARLREVLAERTGASPKADKKPDTNSTEPNKP